MTSQITHKLSLDLELDLVQAFLNGDLQAITTVQLCAGKALAKALLAKHSSDPAPAPAPASVKKQPVNLSWADMLDDPTIGDWNPDQETAPQISPQLPSVEKNGWLTVAKNSSSQQTVSHPPAQPTPQSHRKSRHSGCKECGGGVQVYDGEPNPYCSECYNRLRQNCSVQGCTNKCHSYIDRNDGTLKFNATCKPHWDNRPWCKGEGCRHQVGFDEKSGEFNPMCRGCHVRSTLCRFGENCTNEVCMYKHQ